MEISKESGIKVDITKDKLAAYISFSQSTERVSKDDIYRMLAAAGVVYGLKHDVIESLSADLLSTEVKKQPVLVAEGIPAQPGEDERIEMLFAAEKRRDDESEDQKMDFRETSTIVSVETGTVLATKHPARPGKKGKSVTGEILSPAEPGFVSLLAGKGVEIQEKGTKAVALVNGRPWGRKTPGGFTVGVDPLYVHMEDVCIKSGHVRFKGHVKIMGNVCEAMEVVAAGNVEVMGLVTGATVNSGGKLVVRGEVVNSKLKTGFNYPEAKKLYFFLLDLKTNLEALDNALEQLKVREQFENREADFGRIVLALLDSRFKDVRPLTQNTIRQIISLQKLMLPEEIANCARALSCLVGLNPLTIKNFDDLLAKISQALESLRQHSDSPADVLIFSASMSNIHSSGNVYVTSLGCVNTVINSGGNVIIKGAFKGGEIFCEGNAEIQELGSNLGTPTLVRVSSKNHIKIKKAYPGSVIQIGQRKLTLNDTKGPFKARLNKDGYIKIT